MQTQFGMQKEHILQFSFMRTTDERFLQQIMKVKHDEQKQQRLYLAWFSKNHFPSQDYL